MPVDAFLFPLPQCANGQTYGPPLPGVCKGGKNMCGVGGGGQGGGTSFVGNPCDAGTGNKYETEEDYQSSDGSLTFTRHYNSQLNDDVGLGQNWTSSFHKRLEINPILEALVQGSSHVLIRQASGRSERFRCDDPGICVGDPDTKLRLSGDATGYTLTLEDSATERYDLNGRLTAETDRSGKTTIYGYDVNGDLETSTGPFGHALTLTYNAGGRLATLTAPDSGVYTYSYDANGNLTQVEYPDTTTRIYHYEDTAYPNHLTGITDENGDRF
ncbi:MAG: DUF6531 domain-containing protein, partial [Acidiferrobacterales bacterium]